MTTPYKYRIRIESRKRRTFGGFIKTEHRYVIERFREAWEDYRVGRWTYRSIADEEARNALERILDSSETYEYTNVRLLEGK